MQKELTTIALSRDTKERLDRYGVKGQSYDDLLQLFMDKNPLYKWKWEK